MAAVNASIDPDFDHAFAAFFERRTPLIISGADPFFRLTVSDRLLALADEVIACD